MLRNRNQGKRVRKRDLELEFHDRKPNWMTHFFVQRLLGLELDKEVEKVADSGIENVSRSRMEEPKVSRFMSKNQFSLHN